jgi:hypothetical protein
VDNAASHIAQLVCQALPETSVKVNDPAHTIDLCSKDAATLAFVKRVLGISGEIFKFCRTDRIDGMRLDLLQSEILDEENVVLNYSETRMNNVHEHVQSAIKQYHFLVAVRAAPQYQKYYGERTPDQKQSLDDFFRTYCTHESFEKMGMLTKVTAIFKRVHLLCSRQDVPISAFILVVQAMRNELNVVIQNRQFDEVLGDGAAKELADMIRVRFNMSGDPPPGRKVGLIHFQYIWAYLVDPFQHEWRFTYEVDGPLPAHINKMISHFIPLDDDGSDSNRVRVFNDFMVSVCVCCCFI